jgi:hypothetical protein
MHISCDDFITPLQDIHKLHIQVYFKWCICILKNAHDKYGIRIVFIVSTRQQMRHLIYQWF